MLQESTNSSPAGTGFKDPATQSFEISGRKCITALEKAIRARQLFPESNHATQKYSQDFFDTLSRLLEQAPSIKFLIEKNAIDVVASGTNKASDLKLSFSDTAHPLERLSTLLTMQTLSSIEFKKGTSIHEATRFLNCFFNLVAKADETDTLSSRASKETFESIHLDFTAVGDRDWTTEEPAVPLPPSSQLTPSQIEPIDISEHYDDLLDTVDTTYTDKLAFKLAGPLAINPDELASIHREIEQFTESAAVNDFTDALLELLEREEDADEWKVIADIFINIISFHIQEGHVHKISELLDTLALVSRKKAGFEIHHQNLIKHLSRKTTIEAIIDSCNRNPTINPKGLFNILSRLNTDSLPTLTSLLYHIADPRLQESATQAASELLMAQPTTLEPLFTTDDPQLLFAAFLVVKNITSDVAINHLIALFNNPACSFRTQILKTLKKFPLQQVLSTMLQAIDDPDTETRLEAIKHLTLFKHPRIYAFIKKLVLKSGFEKKTRNEKDALLIALAKLDPKDAYPILNRLLKNRLTFNRTRLIETQQCALVALGSCKDFRAMDRIKMATKSKEKLIRETAQKILLRTGGTLS